MASAERDTGRAMSEENVEIVRSGIWDGVDVVRLPWSIPWLRRLVRRP